MPGFDPFFFFSGSPASHPDSIHSFCFGFSGITPRFNPFVLFRVLRHHTMIRSLRFVSGSPASCPDFIPSFSFGFCSIATGFDPFVLFLVLWHHARILLSFSASYLDSPHLPQHHVRASLIFFVIVSGFSSSSSTSCPSIAYLFRHRDLIFLIFLGIVSEHRLSFLALHPDFSYLHWHWVQITHLPRHRVWVSLSPSIVVTQFR